MDRVLAGLPWETCLVYLDDLIVHAKSFQEELERLRNVFSRFREAGLKLSPGKCHLFQEEVIYLGHVVSKRGVATDPAKVKAVADWPVPRNAKEVRTFVGFCSYYRWFARGFTQSHFLFASAKRK